VQAARTFHAYCLGYYRGVNKRVRLPMHHPSKHECGHRGSRRRFDGTVRVTVAFGGREHEFEACSPECAHAQLDRTLDNLVGEPRGEVITTRVHSVNRAKGSLGAGPRATRTPKSMMDSIPVADAQAIAEFFEEGRRRPVAVESAGAQGIPAPVKSRR